MRLEALRTMNYEVAEAIAPTWERRRGFIEEISTPVRRWMIDALAPRPGDTVLELAAGVGDTGFEAAGMLGAEGRLISSDISPAMLEAARRRGAELGVEHVDYRVIDAERIPVATDSVDGVLCRFGYMLMADPAAALAETRRVLRPGGRLALAVWGAPERNPFFAVVGKALVERGHVPPPEPQQPGIFSLADERRTRALLEHAGFAEVRASEVPVSAVFADVGEYLDIVADTAGPIAMALRGIPEDERKAIRTMLEQPFSPFARAGGYELPGAALVAAAS
ncbi:MAG: class I SAM-dependent methyltransferase [Solirubrobacteraceae bacterium]